MPHSMPIPTAFFRSNKFFSKNWLILKMEHTKTKRAHAKAAPPPGGLQST
jgi:hypothetical protein